MDENPKQFIEELRSAILRKRVGQIALAIVLAQAVIRFLNALVWYLLIPAISNILENHTESVLFKDRRSFPWEQLSGSMLEFIASIIFVFYANRWIHRRASPKESSFNPTAGTDELPGDDAAVSLASNDSAPVGEK